MSHYPERELPGLAFEGLVADAYRALGYQVTQNVQMPGKQTDIIARREIEGAPPIILAIECKDLAKPVGNETVLEFIARVTVHRTAGLITAGALVSRLGFSADGQAAAALSRDVSLLSWADLTNQILDVRHRLREIVQAYEQDPIYENYIELAIELIDWSSAGAERPPPRGSLRDVLSAWFLRDEQTGRQPRALFVLADFGAGKTTLLHRLEYEQARAYLAGDDDRVPLFVPLRRYRETHDLTLLLKTSFRDAYYRDVPAELLWQRLRDGRFYVYLDAFDEMVDRSDHQRRLDLFYELLHILRTPSPVVVTSRPSYFVERGELAALIDSLREREDQISRPGSSYALQDVGIGRLQRLLADRHREDKPVLATPLGLTRRRVAAMRLLPLDEEGIETFVRRHAGALKVAGTSSEQLLDFINRTYDLTDLANRPLLLDLIVESVLLGGLDVSDTTSQYGAAGLYEAYVAIKLAVDLSKEGRRSTSLSPQLRLRLAENLAVEMYERKKLEVEFAETLSEVIRNASDLERELDASGLSPAEVATDFATSSFVTVDDGDSCRFIHKSFRGFFVARVLKEDPEHTLWEQWLEREVLYFLGGFGPTEGRVREALWGTFIHSEKTDRERRRNSIVAYLYSAVDHKGHTISDAEIADANFARLLFEGTNCRATSWDDVTLGELKVVKGKWTKVAVTRCNIRALEFQNSQVDIVGTDSWCEEAKLVSTKGTLGLESWEIENLDVADSREVTLSGGRGAVRTLRVRQGSRVQIGAHAETPFVADEAFVSESAVTAVGPCVIPTIKLVTAALSMTPNALARRVIGTDSLVVIGGESRQKGYRLREGNSDLWELGPGCVVVDMAGRFEIDPRASLAGGVFGRLSDRRGLEALGAPVGWGILDAGSRVSEMTGRRGPGVVRHGDTLIADTTDYAALVRDGQLTQALLDLSGYATVTGPAFDGSRLQSAVESLRGIFKTVLAQGFDEVATVLGGRAR